MPAVQQTAIKAKSINKFKPLRQKRHKQQNI